VQLERSRCGVLLRLLTHAMLLPAASSALMCQYWLKRLGSCPTTSHAACAGISLSKRYASKGCSRRKINGFRCLEPACDHRLAS
jgi:hypothetical protein